MPLIPIALIVLGVSAVAAILARRMEKRQPQQQVFLWISVLGPMFSFLSFVSVVRGPVLEFISDNLLLAGFLFLITLIISFFAGRLFQTIQYHGGIDGAMNKIRGNLREKWSR